MSAKERGPSRRRGLGDGRVVNTELPLAILASSKRDASMIVSTVVRGYCRSLREC